MKLIISSGPNKGQVFDESTIARPASSVPAPAARRPPLSMILPAEPALAGDDARFCRLPAEKRQTALAALDACRRAVSETDPEAADRLASVAGVFEDARNLASVGSWTGPVERTAHLVPRLVNGAFTTA